MYLGDRSLYFERFGNVNFGDGRKVEKELLKKKSKNVLCLNFQSRSLLILAPIHFQCIPFNEAGLFSF